MKLVIYPPTESERLGKIVAAATDRMSVVNAAGEALVCPDEHARPLLDVIADHVFFLRGEPLQNVADKASWY